MNNSASPLKRLLGKNRGAMDWALVTLGNLHRRSRAAGCACGLLLLIKLQAREDVPSRATWRLTNAMLALGHRLFAASILGLLLSLSITASALSQSIGFCHG